MRHFGLMSMEPIELAKRAKAEDKRLCAYLRHRGEIEALYRREMGSLLDNADVLK